ncbi:hypothetical protein HYX00_02585 [Candidatus Woesearchaeota archaeon]|nr:hypothetical protein [Candidatus Woesearchaeota archaeon]
MDNSPHKLFKKSQAALEFLTTYGWAFLVILIMIGTLAYFGILNPSKILPNRCNFGAEFQCLDYQISATAGTFKVRLKNNVGEAIQISSLTLGSEGTTVYSCSTPQSVPITMNSGQINELLWSNCNSGPAGFVAGEKGKVLVTTTYNTVASGTSYARQVKGEVFSSVV